jgi:hypothetical protein
MDVGRVALFRVLAVFTWTATGVVPVPIVKDSKLPPGITLLTFTSRVPVRISGVYRITSLTTLVMSHTSMMSHTLSRRMREYNFEIDYNFFLRIYLSPPPQYCPGLNSRCQLIQRRSCLSQSTSNTLFLIVFVLSSDRHQIYINYTDCFR